MKKILFVFVALLTATAIAFAQGIYYPQVPVSIGVYSTNLPSLKTIPAIASTADVQYTRLNPIPDGTDMLEILENGFSDFPFISVSLVPPTGGFSMSGTFRLSFSALPSGVASRRFQIETGDGSIITFLQVNTSGITLSASPSGPLFPNPEDARELILTGGIEGDTYRLYKDGVDTGIAAIQQNGDIYTFGTVYEPGRYTVFSTSFGMLPNGLSLSYFDFFNPGVECIEGLIEDEEILVSCEGEDLELFFESESFQQGIYYTPLFDKMNSLGIPGKWPAGEVPVSFERDNGGEGMTLFFSFPANTSGSDKVYDTCFCFGENGATLRFRQHSIVTTFYGNNYIGKRTFSSEKAGSFFDDVSYYDGHGYLEQTIAVKAVSESKSLVSPIVYDNMRRSDATSYLSFSMNKTDASYVPDAVTAQRQWYNSKDARPYSETTYETGASGRPLSFMREGKVYADSAVAVLHSYSINDGTEGVIKLTYTEPQSGVQAAMVTPNGCYPANSLSVICTVSEDCDTSLVFKDAQSRLLLSRKINGGTNHDTYYVYNLRDSLACVVQPEGSALLSPSSAAFSLEGEFSDKWCFTYEYDAWGNIVMRHVPGGGKQYYIYDARDRQVLSTNSELMSKGWWRYSEYDALNRITEEGLCKLEAGVTLSDLMGSVPQITDYSEYITGEVILHTLSYQDGVSQSQNGFTPVSGVVTYYNRDVSHNRFRLSGERIWEAPALSNNISQPVYYVDRKYFYDYRGLPVQVAESCSDGWSGRTSMKYDFSGKVLVSVEEHTSPGGTTDRLTLQNTYDDRGRILQSSAEMNGAVLSAAYSYDDLGRMVVKNLNGSDAEDRFSYNLQGWLTSIVSGNGGSIDICNRAIQYYDNSGNPMYGGKISSLSASHYGAASFFTDYSYDNLGRLESETRKTGYSGTIPFSADRYNYDRNGNIISVSHRSGTEIEAITETCFRTGNMLNRLLIEDEDEDPEQFTYDMNGAVTYDG
ncbi:MAG: RHS repeat protein, partial [Bacteroidales bacterium]|nr:RHS repeat protein [Bacteroidales bacterium]